MPSAKRVASRSPSPSPSAGGGGALGLTIKARYVRYKETEGSVVWQPDLAAASELSLVVVLILQGLTSIEFLQQACTCVAGVLAALCVLFRCHRPKGSVLVKSDKNDRLVAASGASPGELAQCLELALPEIRREKHNPSYDSSGAKAAQQAVRGLWFQPSADQVPVFVPCVDLVQSREDYGMSDEEPTSLFATNPLVQLESSKKKMTRAWAVAQANIQQKVGFVYAAVILCLSELITDHFFTSGGLLIGAAVCTGAHLCGCGLNTAAVPLTASLTIPTPYWVLDLLRTRQEAAVVTPLKGWGEAMHWGAIGVGGLAWVASPVYCMVQLRKLVEWMPKDVIILTLQLVLDLAQHLFRLGYRFVLYPELMHENGYTLKLSQGGAELIKLCSALSGEAQEFWLEHPTACSQIYFKRENDDLQFAEKVLLFLGIYCMVMLGLQNFAPQVLQGRGLFFGVMNVAIVVGMCGLFLKVPKSVMPLGHPTSFGW